MKMLIDNCKSNEKPLAVWGELAVVSVSGTEKKSLILNKSEYTIGRSRRCDVRISIKTVSRIHMRLRYDKFTGNMSLFNCGSEEDVFINGTPVKPEEEELLAFGDIIDLSEVRLKLQSPRDEQSEILDETELCSQPAILDKSPETKPAPGGGSECVNKRWDQIYTKESTLIEENFKIDASPFGKEELGSQVPLGKSPIFRKSDLVSMEKSPVFLKSDVLLGTPDSVLNTNKSKRVRFSYFNEIKIDGQKVFSPARKRRRLADRMPTPGHRMHPRLPQPLSKNANSNKRRSWRQVINMTRNGGCVKNDGKHKLMPKMLLTPKVMPKTVDDRRTEIMRRLLACSADD